MQLTPIARHYIIEGITPNSLYEGPCMLPNFQSLPH
jgi:hypothetical protein